MRDGEVGHRRDREVALGLSEAANEHRVGVQRAGVLLGAQHDRTGPVGDQAAVQHMQWVAHQGARQHVLDGERIAVQCRRIQARPLARRHRDLG